MNDMVASIRTAAGAVFCLVVVFALYGVAAAAAGETVDESGGAQQTAAEVVAKVQQRFDDTADMRADVAQEVAVVSLGRSVSASGTVVFKRPGRMHWRLTGDEPQIIVADGETVWFFQPEDEQVLKAPLDSVFRSATPVSFLTGVGKIADDFEAVLGDGGDGGTIELLLDPKRTNGDVGRLALTVSSESFDIVEARVTDPVGNVTQLRFSNLRRNTGVADSEFDFEPPPGVDVVEAPIGY